MVNAQSPIDGFELNTASTVRSIAVQSDGKILIGGFFTTLSLNGPAAITRKYIARLNSDGRVDTSFNPTASHAVRAIAVQSDGRILLGGYFTSLAPNGSIISRNRIARLNPDGTVDPTFDPNANLQVFAIAVQPDGKILIGGDFTTLAPNGGAAITRKCIARLNSNGTVDKSFNPNVTTPVNQSRVEAIQVQQDGKILIGGGFNSLAPNGGPSINRTDIARLNPNGTVDVSFDPSPSGSVEAISLQADGKILFGGWFITVSPNGGAAETRNHIARMNANGTLDPSFNPSVDKHVFSITSEADGQILIGGDFDNVKPFGGSAITRHRIARLKLDGSLDMSFDPNILGGGVFAITQQPDGQILLGGVILTLSPTGMSAIPRSNLARLNQDGSVDQTLDLNLKYGEQIHAIALQPNGKILIGGDFKTVLREPRNRLARLNADGTLEPGFQMSADNAVDTISVQADGKILIAGRFTTLTPLIGGPVKRNHIARLNSNGTVDASFDPNANDDVSAITIQADGKILLGGLFTTLSPNGTAAVKRNGIARLNHDGSLDATFDPNVLNVGGPGVVWNATLQADGKILIGGQFRSIAPNGGTPVPRNHLARLNPDGTVDASFDPHPDADVGPITVQADGKIVVGGWFVSFSPNGGPAVVRNHIARLNQNGTVDLAFDLSLLNNGIPEPEPTILFSLSLQADGRILIGGRFSKIGVNGGPVLKRQGIARLSLNGNIDAFDPNPDLAATISLLVGSDGKLLVGGSFHSLSPNGAAAVARSDFARLTNDAAALQKLTVTQTVITWTRGGAAPELSRVTFEQSDDGGATYTLLGSGTRVGTTSNFTLTGLSLPAGKNVLIRARGYYHGALYAASDSITESVRNVYF